MWFWTFGSLGQRVSPFFPFNMFTWHRYWRGIYPTQIFACSSLTVSWHLHGVEVDELEEDVGDQSPALKVSWKLKREHWRKTSLANQEPPSERSSLCYTVSEYRFWWDVVFDHWSIHKNIRVHRKAFRAIKLLAYPRGLSLSRIYPFFWRKQWPLRASALLHWLLWLS